MFWWALFKDLSKFFNNYEFYGYDINKNLRNKFPNKKNFNFVSGNINKISKKFDLIVMSHSIMYIKDLSNKFRSFSRLLKKEGKINIQIPITLFHGGKDDVVPVSFSKRIFKFCKKSFKKLIIIKNGKHRLSRKNDLKKICSELNLIVKKLSKVK